MGIVLASASVARAAVLRDAGVVFEIVPARVDEDALKSSLRRERATPRGMAVALAELKARDVSAPRPEMVVIGADQILDFEGEVLSKPANLAEAEAQLKHLRGRQHQLISGTVLARGGKIVWRHAAEATLSMRSFSDAF